jgi:tRNA threonylcarbamoyladenosine biosynthesis protein TsaE
MSQSLTFHLHGAAATRSLAASLARSLPPGTLVLLRGNLGAGKTTFAQGMALGLGVEEPVISPTFVLMREYPLPFEPGRPERFVHLDLYRLSGPAELPGLGIEELLDDEALVAMEWPERVEGSLPLAQVDVSLRAESNPAPGEEEARWITIHARDEALGALQGLSSHAAAEWIGSAAAATEADG